ncbi:hypothetical protein AMTR_s00159p00076600 [Amborella trichopoda]|uniref:Uncharacterized protein n=1 Tax=Amborella trichopoda TaxID=13333 RepID=W1PXH3_AMBTC|nr:hypothetical protein AMTR_s00159p00076600 [Amborella trichopoda]
MDIRNAMQDIIWRNQYMELIEWVLCKVYKGRRIGKRRAKKQNKQNCPRPRTSIGKRSAKKQNSPTQRAKRQRQLANTTTESLIYDISQLVKEDIPELVKEIQSDGRDKMGDTHEVDAKGEIQDAEIAELILDCYRELSSSTLEMQVDALDTLLCAYGTELSSNNSDDLDLPVLTQLEEENQGDGIVETDLPALTQLTEEENQRDGIAETDFPALEQLTGEENQGDGTAKTSRSSFFDAYSSTYESQALTQYAEDKFWHPYQLILDDCYMPMDQSGLFSLPCNEGLASEVANFGITEESWPMFQ